MLMTKPWPATVTLLLLAASTPVCFAGQVVKQSSANEAYLNALQGPWIMKGVVDGKRVTYRASGEWVLKGAWLELQMVDASKTPQYQAAVFIGYDSNAHDYVVHWLDQFGAAGARVVATGMREGQRLVVTFLYAKGAFRDTFTRNPGAGTWSLLLESRDQRRAWSIFATYELARPPTR